MSGLHLTDDRLIEICFDVDGNPSDRAHLLACRACESRRLALAGTMDDIGEVLTRQADEAFPAERLARQRARILHRVDLDGRPARVISFPAGHTQDGAPPRHRRSARWGTVAAAVAASFVVGLLAEHLAHKLPGSRQSMPDTRIARQVAVSNSPIRTTQSDDELLGQVELAGTGVGTAALRPLDALTPRAWDAR